MSADLKVELLDLWMVVRWGQRRVVGKGLLTAEKTVALMDMMMVDRKEHRLAEQKEHLPADWRVGSLVGPSVDL